MFEEISQNTHAVMFIFIDERYKQPRPNIDTVHQAISATNYSSKTEIGHIISN